MITWPMRLIAEFLHVSKYVKVVRENCTLILIDKGDNGIALFYSVGEDKHFHRMLSYSELGSTYCNNKLQQILHDMDPITVDVWKSAHEHANDGVYIEIT